MTITQDKADDSVLRLRVGALLKFIGGLLQDRTYKELPDDLAAVKAACEAFVPDRMLQADTETEDRGCHTYYVVEVLSRSPMYIDTVGDIKMLTQAGLVSVQMLEAGPTQIHPSVMRELKIEHGIE